MLLLDIEAARRDVREGCMIRQLDEPLAAGRQYLGRIIYKRRWLLSEDK